MKILMINSVCGVGSTGRICTDLAAALEQRGHVVKIAYGRDPVPDFAGRWAVRIGSDLDVRLHGAYARLDDAAGFGSLRATQRFVKWIRQFDPDVIHLHNLHGYYLHMGVLFQYLKTCGKRILWTLHDCWAFTGHSAYCESPKCEQWKTGCMHCGQISHYPRALTDRSARNWCAKRDLFTHVPNLTLLTPSKWLQELVGASFLREYPVVWIPNGIDTQVFRPLSDSEKPSGPQPFTLLGVASVWEERKGLEDLLRLREIMPKDWAMVLVGLTEQQKAQLPPDIRGITHTRDVQQLRQLYAEADVFVNPTREDNYPTTNLEAISCGTPVVTYPTGGSPESARLFGSAAEDCTPEAMLWAILALGTPEPQPFDFSKETFVNRMLEQYERV